MSVRKKILEHGLSLLFVGMVLVCSFLVLSGNKKAEDERRVAAIRDYLSIPSFDYSDPFHRALLLDVMNVFFEGRRDRNAALALSVIEYKESEFVGRLYQSGARQSLTAAKVCGILLMYLKFLLVYGLVLVLTLYGVQTLAVFRYIRKKDAGRPLFRDLSPGDKALRAAKNSVVFVLSLVLFSPAYVTAYSMRTDFNTDTLFFLVLLAVVSNGLLINYANKFHAFLVAEGRRGYVETALAKNLSGRFALNAPGGIALADVFRPFKRFPGHVLDAIFKSASFQYFSTLKEQASFLITGLVIIEMALNIHGHLNYEMLQQLLHNNYDIVLFIVLLIFFTIKGTEMAADFMIHRESGKYENRAA
jgi:hypothetical protein